MEEGRRRKVGKRKPLKSSPEDDPLWGLFGVWGRVLIVFANIGFLLFLGATILGWGMFKFTLHVFGLGLLLLFSRPNYSPFLSSVYCDSGMTREEIEELRQMVIRKLYGQSRGTPSPAQGTRVEIDVIRTIASDLPAQAERNTGLSGSLGFFGKFLRRFVDPR